MTHINRGRVARLQARDQRPRLIAMYETVVGAGPARSLADCQTKDTYSGHAVAIGAATLLSWRGLTLEPYRCPWCDDYHLRHRRSD